MQIFVPVAVERWCDSEGSKVVLFEQQNCIALLKWCHMYFIVIIRLK